MKKQERGFLSRFMKPSAGSLGVARFFSWVSLVLIIGSSVVLALFIGSNTTKGLLNSQEAYALLLAENMNKQIFRRFTLPVAYATGRIALGEPDQYRLLDETVESLMHGLRIDRIRIYDDKSRVTFSTVKEEVQREDLSTAGIPLIFQGTPHYFEVITNVSFFTSFFRHDLPEKSYMLRTVYPLTVDEELGPFQSAEGEKPGILGALEIIQDVTSHYEIAIRSQWVIIFGFIASTLVLFVLLQFVARKAEKTITERMEQNRKLQSELHQSEKLASMGRMVASIAHEIRNPLGIIRSSAEFLLRRKDVDTTSKPILEAIYDESRRLGATVNDFLDYARPREPGNEAVNLSSVVDKVWAFLSSSFQNQGVDVKFDLDNTLSIAGDGDLLYRAFYNIFVNAQQAMGGQGTFLVHSFRDDRNRVHILFQDSGPGFPETNPQKALDPFFTTKDSGTGLGLPIVQSIITSHHGQLLLSNAVEQKEGKEHVTGARLEAVFPSFSREDNH